MSRAAAATASSIDLARVPVAARASARAGGGWYSAFWFCTSFGTSSSTGPGRPSCAIATASRTCRASSEMSWTRWLYLVIGSVSPMMSVS